MPAEPLTMNTATEQIAISLAAAYWRGRLDQAGLSGSNQYRASEPMIEAAANHDSNRWADAAHRLAAAVKEEAIKTTNQ